MSESKDQAKQDKPEATQDNAKSEQESQSNENDSDQFAQTNKIAHLYIFKDKISLFKS